MSFDEEYGKFNYYIESGIESLREDGWSDGKIAYYLRDMAQLISPRGRKAGKKITIDPFKITDKELSVLPIELQDRIKKLKEKFGFQEKTE